MSKFFNYLKTTRSEDFENLMFKFTNEEEEPEQHDVEPINQSQDVEPINEVDYTVNQEQEAEHDKTIEDLTPFEKPVEDEEYETIKEKETETADKEKEHNVFVMPPNTPPQIINAFTDQEIPPPQVQHLPQTFSEHLNVEERINPFTPSHDIQKSDLNYKTITVDNNMKTYISQVWTDKTFQYQFLVDQDFKVYSVINSEFINAADKTQIKPIIRPLNQSDIYFLKQKQIPFIEPINEG